MSSGLSWQQQWQTAFKSLPELLTYLKLPLEVLDDCHHDHAFPLRVPLAFAERMQPGNAQDPLLRQVLPLQKELTFFPGYHADPLAEADANPIPGVLHKYAGRILVTLSGACAVHCRYCFRRHFPYAENQMSTKQWPHIFEYLTARPDISEVILSGGDPLALSDGVLHKFLTQLSAIASVKYVRVHTRFPIMIPARITPELVDILRATRFRTTMVLHSNHPQEWHPMLHAPLQQLKIAGITLLNQAVLLRHVNDAADTLIDLSYRLYDYGVLPYYLHVLDKVAGAAHFEVPHATAVEVVRAMIHALPGYLVPKLVYEAPHRLSKIPVNLEMM